jgi:hypothetical protein
VYRSSSSNKQPHEKRSILDVADRFEPAFSPLVSLPKRRIMSDKRRRRRRDSEEGDSGSEDDRESDSKTAEVRSALGGAAVMASNTHVGCLLPSRAIATTRALQRRRLTTTAREMRTPKKKSIATKLAKRAIRI